MRFKVASRVRGLSDEAFREAFGTEEQCRAALLRLRWPDGFLCPCCGHRGHCVLAGRGLYQCNRCTKQTSPTAGTIFHATKLPLTLWFAAIHLIVTAKNGISSVELGRRLGVKQPTAWTVKHKIMAVMARREGETRLTGRVEMDDAYLGGVRSGGKRGRGAAGKTPFVAAVSTSPEGRPRKLKLAPVKGFRKREIARGAKHWLAPGAAVVTDGLAGRRSQGDSNDRLRQARRRGYASPPSRYRRTAHEDPAVAGVRRASKHWTAAGALPAPAPRRSSDRARGKAAGVALVPSRQISRKMWTSVLSAIIDCRSHLPIRPLATRPIHRHPPTLYAPIQGDPATVEDLGFRCSTAEAAD